MGSCASMCLNGIWTRCALKCRPWIYVPIVAPVTACRCCWRSISRIPTTLSVIILAGLWFGIRALRPQLSGIDFVLLLNQRFWKLVLIQELTWFDWLSLLVFSSIVIIAVWRKVVRDRKKVLLKDVIDYTKDPPRSADSWRFLLLAEFLRLTRLYATVDEQGPVHTAVHREAPLQARIGVIEVSELLKSAETIGSRLKIGSVEIPWAWASRLWSTLVVRPTMIGSIYEQGDRRIFLVQLTREGQTSTWRVERSIVENGSSDSREKGLDEDMIEEMACRIFTETSLGHSTFWRAVRSFNEGLQRYRESLETAKPDKLKLKQAEKNFLKALEADGKFGLAYYNLGVVYLKLKNYDSALEAFLRGIKWIPDRWEPFYAMALIYLHKGEKDRNHFITVARLCDRVIQLAPSSTKRLGRWIFTPWCSPPGSQKVHTRQTILARAHDLRATAAKPSIETDRQALERVITGRLNAATYAWSAWFWSAAKGTEMCEASKVAVNCLKNLSVAYTKLAIVETEHRKRMRGLRRAESILLQALRFQCDETDLLLELGRVYLFLNKPTAAIRRIESAIAVAPEDGRVWAYLAAAYMAQYVKRHPRPQWIDTSEKSKQSPGKAFDRFVDHIGEFGDSDPQMIRTELEQLFPAKSDQRMLRFIKRATGVIRYWKSWRELQYNRANQNDDGQPTADNAKPEHSQSLLLQDLMQKLLDEEDLRWGTGMMRITEGSFSMESDHAEHAADSFAKALECLEADYPRTVNTHGTKAKLVCAQVKKGGQLKEAFENAGQALHGNRLHHLTRRALAEVYFEIKDYRRAIEQYDYSLLLGSTDPKTYLHIGRSWLNVADDLRDAQQRREAFKKAEEYFEKSLELYRIQESAPSTKEPSERDPFNLNGMALAHFWLGRVKRQLGEHERAVHNFRIAETIMSGNSTLKLFVAEACLRNKQFADCEKKIREIINADQSKQAESDAKTPALPKDYDALLCPKGVVAMALILFSYSLAQRDGNLDEALNHISRAERIRRELRHGQKTSGESDESRQELERERNDLLERNLMECKGWILLKQGKLRPAIKRLKRAVHKNRYDPEPHLHLALAYEKLGRSHPEGAEKERCVSEAKTFCTHARELDLEGKYLDQTTDLMNRLRFQ